MSLTFTILGCGNSAGVPTLGNYWGQCDPAEPKNIRSRASALVQSDSGTTLVIDTGADFRIQANEAGLTGLDAVLYTHAHGDHVYGIDDLRVLRNRTKQYINIYGNQATIDEIRERFAYMFIEQYGGIYPRVLEPHVIPAGAYNQIMQIGDIEFTPFEQEHGTCKSLGFRFGDLAYSTDMVDLDQAALETLRGIKTWIVDGAGYKMEKNMVHATLKQVDSLCDIIQPETVYLTHLSPAMDYQTLLKETPDHVFPAYDGLQIRVNV